MGNNNSFVFMFTKINDLYDQVTIFCGCLIGFIR